MGNYATPYNGPSAEIGLPARQRIVEGVVGGVDWDKDGEWGYCTCPGGDLHTHKDGRRDCRAFAIEGRRGGKTLPPGVYCLHTSCEGAVGDASHKIRSLIGKAKVAAAGKAEPRFRAGAGETKGGTFRAVERVRKQVTARPPETGKPTPRTGNWGLLGKQGGVNPTSRTDVSRPLAQFAHARMHTHDVLKPATVPSVPSTEVAKPSQPTPKEQPAAPIPDANGRVFHPTKMIWQTRAEWEQELQTNPIKPTSP